MSELIRTCKRCGRQYTGWHCTSQQCRISRAKRNASARKSRARHGGSGSRKLRSYAAGGFSWGKASVVSVYADACPKQRDVEPEASGNYTRDEVDYMRHPD